MYMKKMIPVLLAILVLLSISDVAYAIQEHTYPGWYTHQIGHVFFFFGLLVAVVYILKYFRPIPRAWKFFLASITLWAIWNILTFIGHVTARMVEIEGYILKTYNIYAQIWLFVKIAEPLVNLIAMIFLYRFVRAIKSEVIL